MVSVQAFPGCVVVTDSGLRAAADACLIAIRSRRLSGRPHSKILEELAAAFIEASATGQSDVRGVVCVPVLPTVALSEVVARTGLSDRQVRRLAPKLGGKKIGGRWFVDEQALQEHLEGQESGSAVA